MVAGGRSSLLRRKVTIAAGHSLQKAVRPHCTCIRYVPPSCSLRHSVLGFTRRVDLQVRKQKLEANDYGSRQAGEDSVPSQRDNPPQCTVSQVPNITDTEFLMRPGKLSHKLGCFLPETSALHACHALRTTNVTSLGNVIPSDTITGNAWFAQQLCMQG